MNKFSLTSIDTGGMQKAIVRYYYQLADLKLNMLLIRSNPLGTIPRLLLILLLSASIAVTNGQSPHNKRQTLLIDRDWKFLLGDHPGAELAGFDDRHWNSVNIPHNFSEPYFQSAKWYTGYGWYRKHFNIPANYKSKRFNIEFEGAFREAEIFINGKMVGQHEIGYTGFSVDINSAIKPGDNILAVRLTNRWNAQLTPRDGDHNFTGGIYRDVYLVVTNPVHISWYGTFVTTPGLTKQSGFVHVKTEVVNQGNLTKNYELRTSIVDLAGKEVDHFRSSLTIKPGKTVQFEQTGNRIPNPQLWSPQSPVLYKAISTLYDGLKLTDRYETPFGFRWVEWTADKGFFLNGEHYYFKGANVHQDHAGWASAVTNAGFVRDIKLIKEAGFDFIRGSHYPHDPSFADACDTLGVLFWSENTFWGCGGYSREGDWGLANGAYPVQNADRIHFEASVKMSLREMIRVNRNHPSIITWSMSNEPFFTEKSTLPRVREFLKELTTLSHELDPSRKVAIGGVQRADMDKTGDIAGYNGDGARIFINPGIPNVVSEYGSTIADRPGKYEPGFGDLKGQPQFEWRSGQAIWCAFDYGTHAGNGTLGRMGIIDYYRIPKRAWYWYRNEYAKIPPPMWPEEGIPAALQLTADKTKILHADGTDDAQIMVTVADAQGRPLSNSPDVTFELVSGPGEFPTGSSIQFSAKSDIAIRDGKAAIEFRTYNSGESVIRASSPGLKDAYITIRSEGAPAFSRKTKAVTERPYYRFTKQIEAVAEESSMNYTYNKPTLASSEDDSHSGRFVNDQNEKTFWMARTDSPGEWVRVDLENSVTIKKVKLILLHDGAYQFKIQVSVDGANWHDAVDSGKEDNPSAIRSIPIPSGNTGRFVRVLFTGQPNGQKAALRELEVYGKN
jgi:beta-galactosidase